MNQRQDIEFTSQGTICSAWLYPPANRDFANQAGMPCVVMAHGFGGTRDAGLEPYAEKFAAAGFYVLLFDYRHFGASEGRPRQLVSVSRQLQDWAAAIAHARSLEGVDPKRIALWGSSFSGGHVVVAGARDGQVAAISAQGAMMDGFATLLNVIRYAGIGRALALTWAGLLDLIRSWLALEPHRIPIIAPEGQFAVMSSAGAYEGYAALTPASWINEVCARFALTLALYRPIACAAELPCPLLVLICEQDNIVPPEAATKTAQRAGERAEVRRYDVNHFDIYVNDGFKRSSNDQLDFFKKTLAA